MESSSLASGKYWFDGCPVRTHFCNALSVLFPAWELAFAEVVRAYKSDISDPALLRRMDQFIAQETAHGKAHHSHNVRVGITDLEDKEFEKIRLVLRRPKMRAWLAAMVSIEHIASSMSRYFLTTYTLRTGREFALFRWHSMEELEHKSLAIDLWDALGYSRTELKKLARGNLRYVVGFIVSYVFSKLRQDGTAITVQLLRGVGQCLKLLGYAVWISRLLGKPNFHPDNIDDSKLLTRLA